ncbi:hypothetical protein [Deinococcus aquiradiocola]|uniref:Uncharacterized protein n=1 Tax=Deinococcus aquiradiocola TaxID=393059 RepID=A0A917UM94_9DEIO|nr:hypothetical protein [Deinococcus aquiradiocola]GGJ67838.1 hypothetical protein GCM10008939_10200 [Deinococcus aquiradiocola]
MNEERVTQQLTLNVALEWTARQGGPWRATVRDRDDRTVGVFETPLALLEWLEEHTLVRTARPPDLP